MQNYLDTDDSLLLVNNGAFIVFFLLFGHDLTDTDFIKNFN